MCFYDQQTYQCGDFKWGQFRLHCSRETRSGETCGLKLVMETFYVNQKCKICEKIENKQQRRTTELDRIRRLGQEGRRNLDSIKESRDLVQSLNTEIKDAAFKRSRMLDMAVLRSMASEMEEIDKFFEKEFASAVISLQQLAQNTPRIVSDGSMPTQLHAIERSEHPIIRLNTPQPPMVDLVPLHPALDLCNQQIRLFKLTSSAGSSEIEGVFHCVMLSACPPYSALSYTWGDPGKRKLIKVNGKHIAIHENLWWFLRLRSSDILSKWSLFWIDAICIDQANITERNHQVGLMKQIYNNAANVIIWLGREAEGSDVAMSFIAKEGSLPLKPKGSAFRRIWTREQGKSLLALCERHYWRRIWIIQEVIHARQIIVLCGQKIFKWRSFENLYKKLKTIELSGWIAHYEFAAGVLGSFASVMVWQRAHWRHPQTPAPPLRTLLEVFQDWQCSDVRDKVFGLLSLVNPDVDIAVDYSKSVEEVYDEVRAREGASFTSGARATKEDMLFDTLLRRALKLPEY